MYEWYVELGPTRDSILPHLDWRLADTQRVDACKEGSTERDPFHDELSSDIHP